MISIILPLKNESSIIKNSLKNLLELLKTNKINNTEILCIINDTTDGTEKNIKKIKNKLIKIIYSKPGYGEALLTGIKKSRGDIIVILNADLIDEKILKFAKYNLINFDLIIGSKRTYYALDKRPIIRRAVTYLFNFILKIIFNFKGSDTHGIKTFKKNDVIELINFIENNTIKFNDIIDTLIVLYFQIKNKSILEYPIKVEEKRPSRFNRRFIYIWKDFYYLIKAYLKLKMENKKNFYNKISNNWIKIMNYPEYKKRENLIFNYFLKNFNFKNKKVLDAGCGIGLISEKLKNKKSIFYGIDYSENNINYVKNKLKSKNFFQASVTKLPFKNNFFDLIIYTEVIEHLEKNEQKKSLEELYRVLKPNGLIILTTPNKNWRFFFRLLEILKIRPYHGIENWYSIKELKNEIKLIGFKILNEYHFNFIYPIKFLDFFERFKFLSPLMINQGYLLKK